MKILISAILALTLSSCAVNDEDLFPHSGITVSQVYNSQVYGIGKDNAQHFVNKRIATDTERSINPYINHNTPRPEFRMLANPTMYLFVNTHLSTRDNIVVPAYVTEFKLLKRDQYAMAGEVNLSNYQ